jgi:hypothetical protein
MSKPLAVKSSTTFLVLARAWDVKNVKKLFWWIVKVKIIYQPLSTAKSNDYACKTSP